MALFVLGNNRLRILSTRGNPSDVLSTPGSQNIAESAKLDFEKHYVVINQTKKIDVEGCFVECMSEVECQPAALAWRRKWKPSRDLSRCTEWKDIRQGWELFLDWL